MARTRRTPVARSTEFLCPDTLHERIARRQITAVIGDPKVGKSLWAYRVAAEVSRQKLRVVFATKEDRPIPEVCVPRLIAAGANMDYVNTGFRNFSLPRDIDRLRRVVETEKPALIVLDTLDKYLDSGLHGSRLTTAFEPVLDMIEEASCAILATSHPLVNITKNMSLERIVGGGGRGLSGTIRTAYFMVVHPDDEDKRIVKLGVHNFGGEEPSLTYDFDVQDVKTVTYAGQTDEVVIGLLAGPRFDERDWSEEEFRQLLVNRRHGGINGRPPEKRSACAEDMVGLLRSGRTEKHDLEDKLKLLGHTIKTIRNAADHLEVVKSGGSPSYWSLPPGLLEMLGDEENGDG